MICSIGRSIDVPCLPLIDIVKMWPGSGPEIRSATGHAQGCIVRFSRARGHVLPEWTHSGGRALRRPGQAGGAGEPLGHVLVSSPSALALGEDGRRPGEGPSVARVLAAIPLCFAEQPSSALRAPSPTRSAGEGKSGGEPKPTSSPTVAFLQSLVESRQNMHFTRVFAWKRITPASINCAFAN